MLDFDELVTDILRQIWLGFVLSFGVYALSGGSIIPTILIGALTGVCAITSGIIHSLPKDELKLKELELHVAFLQKQNTMFQDMCKEYEESVLIVCGPEAKGQVDSHWMQVSMRKRPEETKALIDKLNEMKPKDK